MHSHPETPQRTEEARGWGRAASGAALTQACCLLAGHGLALCLSSQLLLLENDLALGVAGQGRESHGLAFST